MNMNRPPVFPVLLFIALVAPATLPAYAGSTYCCTDDRGKNVCGDVLPNECYGRAYREVGSNGAVLRHIDAPLTAKQREQRDADAARKKADEIIAKEEQRKNDALLNTYASEKDIDFMLDRALADMSAGAKEAQAKYDEAIKRKQRLDGELEFYKKKPAPDSLKEQIKINDVEIKTQQLAIETKKKEMDQVRVKFAEEKRRYIELKQGRKGATSSGTPPVSASTAAPAPAKTK